MGKFKLLRTKQCAKCPWKVDVNPHDIPNGYCEIRHANLKETIAEKGSLKSNNKVMACHHSKENEPMHCVGWLYNQLGVGNNIPLRLQMMNCENLNKLQIVGKQYQNFEDTLPKNNEKVGN